MFSWLFVLMWFTCISSKAWWDLEKNYRLLRYHRKSGYLELSPAVAFFLFASVIHAKPVRDLFLLDWPKRQNKLEMRFCRRESRAGPDLFFFFNSGRTWICGYTVDCRFEGWSLTSGPNHPMHEFRFRPSYVRTSAQGGRRCYISHSLSLTRTI